MNKPIKIYLASPFFNNEEIETMEKVLNILRNKGLDVFAPYENQNKHLIFGSQEWRSATFESDVNAIDNCDAMVAILDGNYSDSGTCWECCYAYKINKPLIVFNKNGKEINLMIAESLHAILETYNELNSYDFKELKQIPYEKYVW